MNEISIENDENDENDENVPTFEDLTQQLKGDDYEPPVESVEQIEELGLKCPHCDWRTHPKAKDKKRGIRTHIKKKHREIFNETYGNPSEIHICPPKIENLISDFETMGEDIDLKKEKLVGDLDLLRIKFPDIIFNWDYSPTSSIGHLKRQKSLFLRVLNDEAGTRAMMNLLVIGSKAIEKVSSVSGVANIDGYAEDVKANDEEIYPILKNMVDTGVLDIGHLSPELRLGMIMASLAINRLEQNKLGHSDFLVETQDADFV